MTKTHTAVEDQSERLRQLVIEARTSAEVAPDADAVIDSLNALYKDTPEAFTAENVRWLNKLRGVLAVRLAGHGPKGPGFAKKAKRKGDTLDHCWRCETPVDERFTDICPDCDSKAYHWRVCPVCRACGCQRSGKTLV